MRFLLLTAGAALSLAAIPQTPALEISLATNSALEQRGRDQLRRIAATWDLSRWVFTRRIRIESGTIPHSHPVLTVNTQYVARDTAQIATFVHEQLHWFFDAHAAATDSAIADLKRLYPQAPSGPPEGARDLASTYLHLLVCLSELNAMQTIFDEATARRTLESWQHYAWIYREVLARPAPIQAILRKYRLDSPDARK